MKSSRFHNPVGQGAEERRDAQLAVLDMIKTRIMDGGIDGLAVIFVGKTKADDTADYGIRYMVGMHQLDFVDICCKEMMRGLTELYGVTPEFIRAERLKGIKGG